MSKEFSPSWFPQGVKGGNPKFLSSFLENVVAAGAMLSHPYSWQGDFARLCFTL